MPVTNLTRNLFSARNLKMRSYMRVPSVYIPNPSSPNATVTVYPCIMMVYDAPSSTPYDQRPKDAFFKVNQKNYREVVRFFQTVATWFESDQYQDLFIMDENEGRLMVNMDYRNLKVQIQGGRFDPQSMLAIPAVITNDSVQSEGCALAINRTNYTCALTSVDVSSILGILEQFSFQAEVEMLINLASRPEFRTDQPPRFGNSRASSGYDPSRKVEW